MTDDVNNMMGSLKLNDYNMNYQNTKNSKFENTNPLNNMNSMNNPYNQMSGGDYRPTMNQNQNMGNNMNMYMNQPNYSNQDYYSQPNTNTNMYDYNMMMQDQYLRNMTQNEMSPQE